MDEQSKAVNETVLKWGSRLPLLSRRSSVTHALTIGTQKLFVRIGHYTDRTPGEIFIKLDREGSTLAVMTDAWCIALSFSLQWGVPLEKIVNKYLWTRCEPDGPVTGHPDIIKAYSIPDLVARLLAIEYLGRREIIGGEKTIHSPTNGTPPLLVEKAPAPLSEQDKEYYEAKIQGYTGDRCSFCSSFRMRRSGTCQVCEDCQSTSGCS